MKKFFKNKIVKKIFYLIGGAIAGLILSTTFNGILLPFQLLLSSFAIGVPTVFLQVYYHIKTKSIVDWYNVVTAIAGGWLILILL